VDAATTTKPKLRGVFHQVAFFAFLPLLAVLVVRASGGGPRFAVVVYSFCLLAMLGVSALYHRGRWSPAWRLRFRRLDHSTILLAIAGTYTPVIGLGLASSSGRARTVVLAVVWVGAVVGIAIRMLWLQAPPWLVAAVYIGVGWVAVLALPTIARAVGGGVFGLVLGGGVLYTVGAVAYATKRPNPWPSWFGYHEIFHTFVVVAAFLHYLAVLALVDRP
jgi:hemolysin III